MKLRPLALTLAFVLAAAAFAACQAEPASHGQDELAEAAPGTPKTDVLELLPPGGIEAARSAEEARLVNGYRMDRYLVEGAMLEVVWIHRPGSGGEYADPREELTPVIFRQDVLEGWGWDHFDEVAARHEIAVPAAGAP